MEDPTSGRVRALIIRTLQDHPNITKSMLTVCVRPQYPGWADELETLVEEGKVVREPVIRATGRASVVYRLPETKVASIAQ